MILIEDHNNDENSHLGPCSCSYCQGDRALHLGLNIPKAKHEWKYHNDWSVFTCPECGGDKWDIGAPGQLIGHAPDCLMAKLLEGVD